MIKKRILFLFLLVLEFAAVSAQDYSSFTETLNRLYTAGDVKEIDRLWNSIRHAGIPYTFRDSVAFLYRGEAKSVAWYGDFNQWGHDKSEYKQWNENSGNQHMDIARIFSPGCTT